MDPIIIKESIEKYSDITVEYSEKLLYILLRNYKQF